MWGVIVLGPQFGARMTAFGVSPHSVTVNAGMRYKGYTKDMPLTGQANSQRITCILGLHTWNMSSLISDCFYCCLLLADWLGKRRWGGVLLAGMLTE